MPFVPHTDADVQKMLETIGVNDIDSLFDEIPSHLRSGPLTNVPDGQSEMALMQEMSRRAKQDAVDLCFIGAGAYEHHIPAAVWDIASRGEFMTAYTPYQAEASQGTLQLVYEYQSMMTALTGLDVSNASLYDGASAVAEAVLMAVRANRKSKSKRILIAGTLHPHYRAAVQAIVGNQDIVLVEVACDAGTLTLDHSSLTAFEGDDFAGMVIAQPNFYGSLEDVGNLTNWAHAQNMLVIAVVNPLSLALLAAPSEWGDAGADIAVGEGQPLGIPVASGGPYFGFICCKEAYVRQMPGRIIGQTVDLEGKVGYALTLQAREQHIRRSKATSNICTNQGLMVTAATIYMSLLGYEGLHQVATSSHANAEKLRNLLRETKGVRVALQQPIFHEFVLHTEKPARLVLEHMESKGILGGLELTSYAGAPANSILVCVTETKTDADLARYVAALQQAIEELEAVTC